MKFEVREVNGKFYAGYVGTENWACRFDTREECEEWIVRNEPKQPKEVIDVWKFLVPDVGKITSKWDKRLRNN